jgi:antitoxin HicB
MNEPAIPLRYSMLIQWSDEDDAFLVTLPEWDKRVFNPVTHGDTYEEAARNGQIALECLASVVEEHDKTLPEPNLFVFTD